MSANSQYNQNKSILVTIVTLIFMACAFIFGIIVTDKLNTDTTPLVSTVLGFISLGIVSLVALLGQSKTQHKIDNTQEQIAEVDEKVDKVLNGEMEAKVRKIIEDALIRHMEDNDDGHGSVTKTRYFLESLDPDQN